MILTTPAAKRTRTWNFVADQDFRYVTRMSGTAVLDATYGLGISTATTVVVGVPFGAADIRVTGVMRYRAPTTAGAEYMGVFARMKSFVQASDQDYVFARQHQGNARVTPVVAGTFGANIATGAFALPADVDVTIVLQIVGTAVTCTFTASGVTTANLSGTTSVAGDGFCGFRTLSQVGWCSALTVEEL